MKFNLLSLVLLTTSACIILALARTLGTRSESLPAYFAAVVFVFGASCVIMFTSRNQPSGWLVHCTEVLVALAILVILVSLLAPGCNTSYRS